MPPAQMRNWNNANFAITPDGKELRSSVTLQDAIDWSFQFLIQ